MNELEDKLWELKEKGHETVDIIQVLSWIVEIKRKSKPPIKL